MVSKFDVNLHYPNKFNEKLKKNPKASMNIKLLTEKSVILTCKLGEVVTIHADKVKPNTCLHLKPYSYQENQELPYEVWSDSRHYKEIYSIYEHNNRLYLVSTDHNLTIWQQMAHSSNVKYLYCIKFLTAPVQFFFHCENDPRTVFALLKDSAVRSFSPLEEGNHQINEYWKFSKKFKIKKAMLHPS